MILYAESSAVLAWLLGEPDSERVREALASAELMLSSELTLIECERVLIRAVVTGAAREQHWTLLSFDPEVAERARRPFPNEPIRTLDALHLAWLLFARSLVPETVLLSRDARLRSAAHDLGFALLPA